MATLEPLAPAPGPPPPLLADPDVGAIVVLGVAVVGVEEVVSLGKVAKPEPTWPAPALPGVGVVDGVTAADCAQSGAVPADRRMVARQRMRLI